jgi:hypothetical protein
MSRLSDHLDDGWYIVHTDSQTRIATIRKNGQERQVKTTYVDDGQPDEPKREPTYKDSDWAWGFDPSR